MAAKVLADDTNQDRMRSLICVFRALRLYAGEFDPPLSHWLFKDFLVGLCPYKDLVSCLSDEDIFVKIRQ